MLDREFFENFGALETGVILPTCNISEELAEMSDEEARVAKRKWRKLARRAKKQLGPYADKAFVKRIARRKLSDDGRKLMETKSK
mgnify:CR=1 FL=1|jgi:hypothetical protein